MRQSVELDLALATSSDVLRKLLGYVVLATLARSLSTSDMGELFFAMTFASMFAMLTELGTHRYLTRKVAQRPERAIEHLSEVLSLRLPALGAAFLLLNGIGWLLMPERIHILLPISLYVLVGDLYYSFGSLFLGLRRVGYRFATGLIDVVLLVVLVLVAVQLGWSLGAVLVCYVVSSVTLVGVTALLVRWRFGRYQFVPDSGRLREVARESFPFFLLVSLGLVYFKVDTMMIAFMRSAEDVARYEAGFKFFEISRFAVRSAGMVFFPLCAGLVARNDWVSLRSLVRKLLMVAAGAGTVLGVGVIWLAPVLIPLVWGSAYETSIPVVRVLFLGLPFLYMSYVSTFVAQALGLERAVVGVMAVAVLGNVSMNAVAVPAWGPVGAAWTTVIGECLLALALTSMVVRGARKLRATDLVPVGTA
jgi:O-antigen/teichoic acid export membrane protein